MRLPSACFVIGLTLAPVTAFAYPAAGDSSAPGEVHAERGGPGQDSDLVAWGELDASRLKLRSASVLVVDESGREVYGKAADDPRPIASITKLMTAMVVLDSGLSLEQRITVRKQDRDLIRLTGSRLRHGAATLTRRELLQLALMASENRAASALARTTFPGGSNAFVRAMNRRARDLGMEDSRFTDPAGLRADNVSTARDLVKLLRAAYGYQLIREATTTPSAEVRPYPRRGSLRFVNTNRLLKSSAWDIELSKTGYINEAGRCLVMRATIAGRPLYIVLLNSFGKLTPFGDSNRLREWLEKGLQAS